MCASFVKLVPLYLHKQIVIRRISSAKHVFCACGSIKVEHGYLYQTPTQGNIKIGKTCKNRMVTWFNDQNQPTTKIYYMQILIINSSLHPSDFQALQLKVWIIFNSLLKRIKKKRILTALNFLYNSFARSLSFTYIK